MSLCKCASCLGGAQEGDHKYDPVLLALVRHNRNRWPVEAVSAMFALSALRGQQGEPSLTEAAWIVGLDAVVQAMSDVRAKWSAMSAAASPRRRGRKTVVLGPNVIEFAAARERLLSQRKGPTAPRAL